MASSKNYNEVAFLARLGGITVPGDRLPALSMGFSGTQAICDSLARLDYGTLPPACRFEAPAAR